jgi:hypothetical protein
MQQSWTNFYHDFATSKLRTAACIFYLTLTLSTAVAGSTERNNGAAIPATPGSSEAPGWFATYDWNLNENQSPLLNLPDQINAGTELAIAFPMGEFRLPLFQSLDFNQSSGKYTLQLIASVSPHTRTIELKETGAPGSYASSEGAEAYLLDNKDVKTIRANDATEYTFVRFTDGAIRCIRVKVRGGAIITLVYTRGNLIHGLVDSLGRTVKFNYADQHIDSISQTWVANSVAVSRNWPVGTSRNQVKLAHASYSRPLGLRPAKPIPNNAVTPQYTPAMAANDRLLAEIFGGPGAVAAADGFEPAELADQYPRYRGDLIADDGRAIRGHLSYAMHLYGNAKGTGDLALYVPAGFTSHSPEPSPTDAAMTFYYPRLGNLTNVTLAVFHVANFTIANEGNRIRIGNIGGPGGSVASYKHSHIEFYRGDTGLPSTATRPQLRIDPASVFGSGSETASRSTLARSARRSE